MEKKTLGYVVKGPYMNDNLTQQEIATLIDGELGENILHLVKLIETFSGNHTFVDLGVETGKSSKVLLHKALEKNNKVYGVDPIKGIGIDGIMNHPNYTFLQKDSVSVGAEWTNARPTIVFIDSVHVYPQVMRELYYWWDLVEVGGWLVFHDTEWGYGKPNGYIHKANHPCAGRKPGNTGLGCDVYAGKAWKTPEYAVMDFFRIQNLDIENEYIKSIHHPSSLGMTYIQKKKEYDYKALVDANVWNLLEKDRQTVLACFK